MTTQPPQTTTLDERSRRRPSFTEGAPVRLANGRTWQLVRPRVRFLRLGGRLRWRVYPTDPKDGFEALVDRLRLAGSLPVGARTLALAKVELLVGRAMLLANYDLTPGEVTRLLVFGYDPRAVTECRIRNEVMAVALGPRTKGFNA